MIDTDMISISITLEQLITVVQQLQPEERAQVARALIQGDLRSDLTALIKERYALVPASENVGNLSPDRGLIKYDFSALVGQLNWQGDAVRMQRSLRDEW